MAREHQQFDKKELASCLRRYDIGTVTSIQEFTRGSHRSPKVIIETDRGKFLFKRRAYGKDNPARVAFTHEIQATLWAHNFPLPQLIRTRKKNESMLMRNGRIYELFEFVEGGEYDESQEATSDAGRILGLYHKLLRNLRSEHKPPEGSYHGEKRIREAILKTVSSLPLGSRPPAKTLTKTVRYLNETYKECFRNSESIGIGNWEKQIVHGDWHPGNILFKDQRVRAVIDYDSARIQQKVIDLANGALQFSILGRGGDLLNSPGNLDEARFQGFIRGYNSVDEIPQREIRVIPYLMCEAMIAEAVLPIAATGSFGKMEGFLFLQMIEKKVNWIFTHLDNLHAAMKP